MCTGNSCRSIIAEALLNKYVDNVNAYSCGVNPSANVNPNAKKILEQNGIWNDIYYSKHLDEVADIDFDLVVTVCDNAKETCPIFPKSVKVLHVGFQDPDGKEFEAFETTYKNIKDVLLKAVQNEIKRNMMQKNVIKTKSGVKINFFGAVEKKNIVMMVENCSTGKCECMSDDTKMKIKDMRVDGLDGDVELSLDGDIDVKEIQDALEKSKVING